MNYLTKEMQEYGHEQFQKGKATGWSEGFEAGKVAGRAEGSHDTIIKVMDALGGVQNVPSASQEIDITAKPNKYE